MSSENKDTDKYAKVITRKFSQGKSRIDITVLWEHARLHKRASGYLTCCKWLYERGGVYSRFVDWLVKRLTNSILDDVRADIKGCNETRVEVKL